MINKKYEKIGQNLMEKHMMIKCEPKKYDYEFALIPIELLEKGILDPVELRVYILLLRRASSKGYCYPSQDTIARQLKYTRENINKAISRLEKRGYIIKETVTIVNNQEKCIYVPLFNVFFRRQARQIYPTSKTKRAQKDSHI